MIVVVITPGFTRNFTASHQQMPEPLTRTQQRLRGREICDMTEDQLRDWIDACEKMEQWVDAAKARRGWRLSGIEAQSELDRRSSKN